jgi:predicted nuclease of predicted toxin-antitoxin system
LKVLLDNNMNPRIYRLLRERHEVHHAAHLGWAALANGKLLKAASTAGFQVMITADKSIPDEQNLSKFPIALVILPANDWPWMELASQRIVAAVESTTAGQYSRLSLKSPLDSL